MVLQSLRSAALLTFTFAVVACAGHRAGLGGSYLPCSVVTEQEMSQAMGETVSNVVPVPPDQCRYFGQNPADFVTIRASETGGHTMWEGANLANAMMHLGPGQSAGVGDESDWQAYVLWARKGDAYVSVNMQFAATNIYPAGEQLAREALARL